jgi:protease-4
MKNFWKYLLATILGVLVVLGLFVLIFSAIIGSAVSNFDKSKKATVSVPANAILKVDFSSALAEQDDENPIAGFTPSLLGGGDENSIGILKAVKAVEHAIDDPNIKMIYINTDNVSGGVARLEELRAALKEFHEESGKPIVSYAENYTNAGYYIASVSDKIMMNKFGESQVTGLATSMNFYKDLFDKLGVQIQLIRHGKYKSAGEPYISNHISDANREMTQEMLNSEWATITEEVCTSRNIPVDSLNGYIDNLELLDAESMLAHGLIDEVAYKDSLEAYLCTLTNVKKPSDLKVVSLEDYADAVVVQDFKAPDKIAVIYANGEIKSGNSEDEITDGNFCKILRKVRADSSVKAVVFRVNSPGGSAQAAENIRREVELLKAVKPVVASYGTYAASGGYWISAGCDSIITDNTTLTGSIGVFSVVPCGEGLLNDKLHVHNAVITTNKHGAMGNVFTPLAPEETAYMQKAIEMIYEEFTSLVSEGRRMSVAMVDSLGQGRVWTGRDALQNGLADRKGGITDAIDCAAGMAGLSRYRVAEYPEPKDAMTRIMNMLNKNSGSSDASAVILRLLTQTSSDSSVDPSAFLTDPRGIYARMEYVYDIK